MILKSKFVAARLCGEYDNAKSILDTIRAKSAIIFTCYKNQLFK